jgi:hypothetical protein
MSVNSKNKKYVVYLYNGIPQSKEKEKCTNKEKSQILKTKSDIPSFVHSSKIKANLISDNRSQCGNRNLSEWVSTGKEAQECLVESWNCLVA